MEGPGTKPSSRLEPACRSGTGGTDPSPRQRGGRPRPLPAGVRPDRLPPPRGAGDADDPPRGRAAGDRSLPPEDGDRVEGDGRSGVRCRGSGALPLGAGERWGRRGSDRLGSTVPPRGSEGLERVLGADGRAPGVDGLEPPVEGRAPGVDGRASGSRDRPSGFRDGPSGREGEDRGDEGPGSRPGGLRSSTGRGGSRSGAALPGATRSEGLRGDGSPAEPRGAPGPASSSRPTVGGTPFRTAPPRPALPPPEPLRRASAEGASESPGVGARGTALRSGERPPSAVDRLRSAPATPGRFVSDDRWKIGVAGSPRARSLNANRGCSRIGGRAYTTRVPR